MTTQLKERPVLTIEPQDLPEGITYNDPNRLTYAIGDISEMNMALTGLVDQIRDAKSEVSPDIVDLTAVDRHLEFEILPIGEAEAVKHAGGHEATDTDSAETIRRNIAMLYDIRDRFGNGSEVVAWRQKSKDQDRPDNKKRWFDYVMVMIKDEKGEVSAMVADSLEHNNAIYLWRRDVSDVQEWTDVFKNDKRHARQEAQARQIKHTGEVGERVMDYLTMPAEEYLDIVTRK